MSSRNSYYGTNIPCCDPRDLPDEFEADAKDVTKYWQGESGRIKSINEDWNDDDWNDDDWNDDSKWIINPRKILIEATKHRVGGAKDEPTVLSTRYNFWSVSDVNTVEATCKIHFDYVVYWTDHRLRGYDKAHLPAKLWTPRFTWMNAVSIETEKLVECALADRDEVSYASAGGRMKLRVKFKGVMANPMNLVDFPFDIDNIGVSLMAGRGYTSVDLTVEGNAKDDEFYVVRRVGKDEGVLFDFRWPVTMSEWTVHGVSFGNILGDWDPVWTKSTVNIELNLHVSRDSPYYFWKALLPLYLLTVLSFSMFEFDVLEFEQRSNTVSTYFLAAFAMLYVVGNSLPKTDFLTKIDKVIVLTLFSLLCTGISAVVMLRLGESNYDQAVRWSRYIEAFLGAFYIVANLWIFLPVMFRARNNIKKLKAGRKVYDEVPHATNPSAILREFSSAPDFTTLQEVQEINAGKLYKWIERLPSVPNEALYFPIKRDYDQLGTTGMLFKGNCWLRNDYPPADDVFKMQTTPISHAKIISRRKLEMSGEEAAVDEIIFPLN